MSEILYPAPAPTPTTGPNRILTLEEYKKRREIDTASAARDDALEAALIGAEDIALKYTGRDFSAAQAAETREYSYDDSVILETDDFVTALSVTIDGRSLAPGAYLLGPREGETYYWIDFSPSARGLSYSEGQMGFTRNLDTHFAAYGSAGRRYSTVTVNATFGWPGGAPASVQQAIVFLVDEFAKSQGSVGDIQAESIADLSYVYQRDAEGNAILPPRVALLLDPYRRIAL